MSSTHGEVAEQAMRGCLRAIIAAVIVAAVIGAAIGYLLFKMFN